MGRITDIFDAGSHLLRMAAFACAAISLMATQAQAQNEANAEAVAEEETAQLAERSDRYWPSGEVEISAALFSRTGLTVRDMDETLKLYRDILGYHVVVDRSDMHDPRLHAFMGLQFGQTIRFVIMRPTTAGEAGLNVGYVSFAEIRNADGSTFRHPDIDEPEGNEPGAAMLMFIVEDIQAIYPMVLEAGYPVISAPVERADGSMSELLMRGPSGERLWVTDRYPRNIFFEKRDNAE